MNPLQFEGYLHRVSEPSLCFGVAAIVNEKVMTNYGYDKVRK